MWAGVDRWMASGDSRVIQLLPQCCSHRRQFPTESANCTRHLRTDPEDGGKASQPDPENPSLEIKTTLSLQPPWWGPILLVAECKSASLEIRRLENPKRGIYMTVFLLAHWLSPPQLGMWVSDPWVERPLGKEVIDSMEKFHGQRSLSGLRKSLEISKVRQS